MIWRTSLVGDGKVFVPMKDGKKRATKKPEKKSNISLEREHSHPVDPEKEVIEELRREGRLFWREKTI